jgi:hypothetical protein
MAVERREAAGKEGIGRVLIVALSVGGWLFLAAGTCLFGLAKPEPNTFYDQLYFTSTRQHWNLDLIRHARPVLLAGVGSALAGLLVYLTGIQQKRHKFPVSLVLAGLLSLALCVYLGRAFKL